MNIAIATMILILILILIITIFYYLSFIKSLYLSKVPYVWSFNRQLEIIKKVKIRKESKIIDLGCGDGKALRFFEKEFKTKWFWVDINSFAIVYGKILNKIYKSNVNLKKWNLLKENIKEYNYIYLYLFPEFMEKIEDWIFSSKSPETIIISTAFEFKKHKAFKIIDEKIFLYK